MRPADPRRPTPARQRPGPRTASALPPLTLVLVVLTAMACGDPAVPGPDPAPAVTTPAGSGPAEHPPGAPGPGGDRPPDNADPVHRALLPAADLGTGWRQAQDPPGTPRWPWAQDDCPAYRDADYPAQGHRRAAAQRAFAGPGAPALQVVESYRQGWGDRAMDDARRVVRACPSYPFLGGTVSFTVRPSPGAAADCLVVRGEIVRAGSPLTVSYFVAIRRGDTVSTLNLPDPGGGGRITGVARRLAGRLG